MLAKCAHLSNCERHATSLFPSPISFSEPSLARPSALIVQHWVEYLERAERGGTVVAVNSAMA
jgi:hypothetical protein